MEIEKTKVETKSARAFGNAPMSVSSSGFGGGGASGNFFDDDKLAPRDSYSSGPRAPVAVRAAAQRGLEQNPPARRNPLLHRLPLRCRESPTCGRLRLPSAAG